MSEKDAKLAAENQQLQTLIQHLNLSEEPINQITVYDEVKVQNETTEQTADTNAGLLPDKKTIGRLRHYQRLACCFGILCVILLLGIIAVCVFCKYTAQEVHAETHTATCVKPQRYLELVLIITIKHRQWKACQHGWEHNEASCYAYNNPDLAHRKTWEEAREDCRGKGSNLAVAHNQQQKKAISFYSFGNSGSNGYWIGLRVEDGRWKLVDGNELTDNSWIAYPTVGHCVISVQCQGWKSVSCDAKQRWICKKSTLSV
ncbi:killer cell lectin-like receptor subfamily B member 1B allele B [Centropristis striata]|uniref:killer cell lectin-like receptor subfamily B member 1B allele B n=1 Tax=Centropristis striata TaxID=184440 RepID=UPI0027DEEEB5|nr:killer cell lectin-like receptor subfamily B member 1B allele B [Centropristis striata]